MSGWRLEAGLFLAAYALYGIARWVVVSPTMVALEHTGWIVSLEKSLGLYHEEAIQDTLGSGAIGWLLSQVYLTSEFLVLPLLLIWLYRRHRSLYIKTRTIILVVWVMAIPVFAGFPVAPPRLAELGIADTVSSGSLPLHSRVVTPFYNPYAAVPSLHTGFALVIGVAVFLAARRRLVRAAGLAWPALVATSTFATGNHFIVDAVAGAALVALGAGLVHFGAPYVLRLRAQPRLRLERQAIPRALTEAQGSASPSPIRPTGAN